MPDCFAGWKALSYTDFMFTHTIFHLKKCNFRLIYNWFLFFAIRGHIWGTMNETFIIVFKTKYLLTSYIVGLEKTLHALFIHFPKNISRFFCNRFVENGTEVNHLWHYFVIHLKTMQENCLVDCKCWICKKSFNREEFF